MTFLLDTNVVSELIKPAPDGRVVAWLMSVPEEELFLSVATVAELRRGAASLAPGGRREAIERWIAHDLVARFSDRLLIINLLVAEAWGELGARSRRAGANLSTMDGFIAAGAVVHSLTLVTRNTRHFTWCGLRLHDPWASP